MGFSVNLQGIKGIEDALKRIDTSLKKDVSNEIAASALKIQSDAKRLAPVNFGQLRNGIKFDKLSELTFAIESTASYSPYVEFGTGGKVSVPSDFQAYAKTFKGGKAGKFKDMVDALTLWVRKKGIGNGRNDKGMAFVIARSILQKGLRPQPFLIPAYEQEKPKLIQRLKKLLNA
jgi:HK97 gp10 family phage protein